MINWEMLSVFIIVFVIVSLLALRAARWRPGDLHRLEAHPIPVVLNLSSWSVKHQSLTAWQVEELCDKYQVPRQIGQAWVEKDHLLPLLDGLDEVSPALRELCVNTITTYRKEHGFVPLVVCSRKEEYLKLNTRLLLQQAVCVQPLTWHHIDLYLTNEGEWSRPLHAALCDDESLQHLVTTPLMLSVMTVAYQGQSVEELKAPQSLEERRKHIFAMYVERMLTRRKPERRYTAQQSRRWLAYLAQQMLQHRQSEFSIDQIQLDWLPTDRLRSVCRGLIVGLEAGLTGALLIGFVAILLRHPAIGAAIAIFCLALSLQIAFIIALYKGGQAWLKHLTVRLLLYFGGYTPWNYTRFLDCAVERILLHKTAGGYMFVHQMLLEYFASL
jgi:hypothetical protein